MSYHLFNSFVELLNRDISTKIGWRIFFTDPLNRYCDHSLLSKGNSECVYKGKFWVKCLIYQVKCSMCEDICICNTYQKIKKIMESAHIRLMSIVHRKS